MKLNRNFKKLRRLIEDEGFGQQELAEIVGIHPRTLSKRMNCPEADGSWKSSEIVAVCKVLHIPQEQIGEYFFPQIKEVDHDNRI